MLLVKLCVIILGLTCPGYLLARCFRLEHSWAAAFPLSALILVETVILFSLTGIPIQFVTVSGVLLLCMAICQILKNRHSTEVEIPSENERAGLPLWLISSILLFAGTILTTVALRTTLFPLRGLDTIFRWEGLARAMLEQQSLDFYPPVSATDYAIYLFPDGIPPLVATVYWWIYATLGETIQQATSISITLQLAATMALLFYGARHSFGAKAAWFALLAACTSPLLISGFAIGQETGFTALSVAGQLCFAWAAVRRPKTSTVIVVALFAALGALARDYGPALALAGFAVLAWNPATRRYLGVFILTTILFSAPWYLRSWALTGNPFFSHQIPGGFDVNAIHVAIINFYQQVYSFAHFDRAQWFNLLKHILTGGFLVISVSIPYGLFRWRHSTPLLVTTLLVTLLWIFSVAQTAGGPLYSTRVLTPALITLAVVTGAAFGQIYESKVAERKLVLSMLIAGLFLLSGYALTSTALYPADSPYGFSAITGTPVGSVQQLMVDKLEATDFPNSGVLTDLPFFAGVLQQSSRFRPVVLWSPEVDFIFDQQLEPNEIQKRLLANNIRLIFIDDQSTTNRFLMKYRFFRESADWKFLLDSPNEAAFFYFDPI